MKGISKAVLSAARVTSLDATGVSTFLKKPAGCGGAAFPLFDKNDVVDGVQILLDPLDDGVWVGDMDRPYILPCVREALLADATIPLFVLPTPTDVLLFITHGHQAITGPLTVPASE